MGEDSSRGCTAESLDVEVIGTPPAHRSHFTRPCCTRVLQLLASVTKYLTLEFMQGLLVVKELTYARPVQWQPVITKDGGSLRRVPRVANMAALLADRKP